MLNWFKAAGIRALRSFAGAILAQMGTNLIAVTDLNWVQILSLAATTGIVSILLAIKGLPEIAAERELPEHLAD